MLRALPVRHLVSELGTCPGPLLVATAGPAGVGGLAPWSEFAIEAFAVDRHPFTGNVPVPTPPGTFDEVGGMRGERPDRRTDAAPRVRTGLPAASGRHSRTSGRTLVGRRPSADRMDRGREQLMDVRSARDVAPVIEHAGTVPVWWLIQPGELRDATGGGFLELVSEWEVAGGGLVDPHSHPTHEFYYIISGRGIMKIAEEEREVGQGDLIRIPPDTVHSIWPLTDHAGLRGLAFAVGIEGAGPVDYTS